MTAAPSSYTAADAVVAALRAHGVEVVFALPGEENLPVVSAMRRADLPMVVCRHEQHAGFMAVAHARLTGRPAVCLATLGPGALNLFTALAQAQLIGVPVLALTGQKPLRDNDEGSFQIVDVVGAARPLVTRATTLADPALAAVTIADALGRATAPPRGAVVVELPEDVAAAELTRTGPVLSRQARPVAGPDTIEELAARIGRAERPLILAGQGSTRTEASRALRPVTERTGLSVLATQMGKGSLPEGHPRSLRSLGIHRSDHAHLALERADLVVAVGYRPSEHPPLAWHQDRSLPVVHLSDEPAAREAGYEPEMEVVGDLAWTLDRLAESGCEVPTEWSDDARQTIVGLLDAESGPDGCVDPLDVVRVVADEHRQGDVVALDNGAYKVWFARHFPAPEPTSLVLDNATASMGAGLAIGTEAARLGHRALAIVGDGGLLMNVGDLETAVRLGVDLTVLVLRDDAYGFIAWHQEEQDRARHAVDLGNPDLVALTRSFGGDGRRVETVEALRSALIVRQPGSGLTLLDCPIDYSINATL